MLQSPELGLHVRQAARHAGPSISSTDHELAARLSYFLWNTTPDDELIEAAVAGKLQDPEGLAAQTKRLLADGRADFAVQRFMSSWMQLDGGILHHALEDAEKAPDLYPEFDAELVAAMRAETEAFVRRTFEEDGTFEDLLTARYAYVNGRWRTLLGFAGPSDAATGSGWISTTAQRAACSPAPRFDTSPTQERPRANPSRVWVCERCCARGLGRNRQRT